MDEIDKIAKYRWEFMRRDPAYIADYARALEIRKEAGSENITETLRTPYGDYPKSKLMWKESDLVGNYLNGSWMMIDPGKTYEDLIQLQKSNIKIQGLDEILATQDVRYALIAEFLRCYYISSSYDFTVSSWRKKQILEVLEDIKCGKITPTEGFDLLEQQKRIFNPPRHGMIIIRIDPTQAVSKQSIRKELNKQFDSAYYRYKADKDNIKSGTRFNSVDYDIILRAGDMHSKLGKTYQQIAMALFPGDFKESNSSANPESKIKSVQQYCARYNELISGGWRHIGV
jgi:hypothetical protein